MRAAPETVRFQTGATGAVGLRFVPPLVLVFAALLAAGLLSGSLGVALGIAVVGTALFASVLLRRLGEGLGTALLTLSDEAVELVDGHGFGLRLRWTDVAALGPVATAAVRRPQLLPGRLARLAAAGELPGDGLIGPGERVTPDPASLPRWLRKRLGGAPPDAEPADATVVVPLGALDPAWRDGPAGVWLPRRRPDLG